MVECVIDGASAVNFFNLGAVSACIEGIAVVMLIGFDCSAVGEFVDLKSSEAIEGIELVEVTYSVEVGHFCHGTYFVIAVGREMQGIGCSLCSVMDVRYSVKHVILVTLMEACCGVGVSFDKIIVRVIAVAQISVAGVVLGESAAFIECPCIFVDFGAVVVFDCSTGASAEIVISKLKFGWGMKMGKRWVGAVCVDGGDSVHDIEFIRGCVAVEVGAAGHSALKIIGVGFDLSLWQGAFDAATELVIFVEGFAS